MERTSDELMELFAELPPPVAHDSTDAFTAIGIPRSPDHRIARALDGSATLLLRVVDDGTGPWPPPIVLEHLAVRHNLLCRITDPSGKWEAGRYTVISCTNADDLLTAYFLRIGTMLVHAVGPRPHSADIRAAVGRLVELLRSLTRSPAKSIHGLWAELFVIARSRDPGRLASGWHQTPGDLFDFAMGSQRLEVKAAVGPLRRHHFALEQVSAASGLEVVIVSIALERSAAGSSVSDLLDRLRERLGYLPALALTVEQVAAATLGSDWRSADTHRFDDRTAQSSMRFFSPEQIPKVPEGLPVEVSEVRFAADLTGIEGGDRTGLTGPLFDALH